MLASDSVEVGVIGDAVVAPEGIDDAGWLASDSHVSMEPHGSMLADFRLVSLTVGPWIS